MESAKNISGFHRLWLWLAAWCGAVLIVVAPGLMQDSRGVLLFLLLGAVTFPRGLLWFMHPQWCNDDSAVGTNLVWLIWLAYLAASGVLLFTKRRKKYFIIYGILCVLLLLNAVGCNRALNDHNITLLHINC